MWFDLKKGAQTFFLVVALTGRSANIFVLDTRTTALRSLKPGRQPMGQPFTLAPCPWDTTVPTDPFPSGQDAEGRSFPVSERIEASLSTSEQNASLEDERRRQTTHVRLHVKKIQRRIMKLTQDLEKVRAYREYGRHGELLKNHVSAMGTGHHQIAVVDYFDDTLPEITLPLNPEKDGPGNLKDYFAKHRKFTGAHTHLVPRLETANRELANAQKALQELENGTMTDGSGREPEQRPITRPAPPASSQTTRPLKTQTAAPYRLFSSREGHVILVGKTAKDNDTVTFKVAKPDDLWLHARGAPGSHVVVKLDRKQQAPPETLKDAATLALFYSDLRKSGKGEVIYTLRKHVKKPKGAKPGSVTVTREKNVWVCVDQARLDRLKESGAHPLGQGDHGV